jgi:hypothetical protein
MFDETLTVKMPGQLRSSRKVGSRPPAPDQPYDQRDNPGENQKRAEQRHVYPDYSLHCGDVSRDGCFGVAADGATNCGNLPADVRSSFRPNIAKYRSRITRNVAVFFNHYVAMNRRNLTRNLATHVYRTVDAGKVARLLTRSHPDVMAKLGDFGSAGHGHWDCDGHA